MKTNHLQKKAGGYISLLAVLTLSILMLSMMLFAYQRAITAQGIQADVQSQADYREKEEAILRSIVAITPNRAIRAMQGGSASSSATPDPLSWQGIFTEALIQSNARQSISPELLAKLNIDDSFSANTGDSGLTTTAKIFRDVHGGSGVATGGLNRDLGVGFPPALNTNAPVVNDDTFPIISNHKVYGNLAAGKVGLSTLEYPRYNLLPYPDINFGYTRPGEPFVAKRNWWSFKLDLAEHDIAVTRLAGYQREFVLSIYEIPSQLPISASSFLALGTHASGEAWQNVNIKGNIFAGRAVVEGDTALSGLATRRGSELSSGSTIGGQSFTGSPFAPGVRETYRLTQGDFFPVSLASESGKAAFVSINRGADFFDRHAHTAENSTVSPTTWNQYSVGAQQCAMTLDIVQCVSTSDKAPTALRFTYMRNGTRRTLDIPLAQGLQSGLPPGYILVGGENSSYTFQFPTDVAYGHNNGFAFKTGVTGTIFFNNATFGDPLVGTFKYGYFRQNSPFEIQSLPSGKICIAIFPERFQAFLGNLGADSLAVNNSIAVNVDYHASTRLTKPMPGGYCLESDYGLILKESADLRSFTKGFSLVTNLRLHFGDDFNVVATTPPSGFVPPGGAPFYPPASLFAPEKRYGVDYDPFAVQLSGQVGSVASERDEAPVRPLDATSVSGKTFGASKISVNLSPILHPAELPPITMMNWLILLEEKRKEFD